MKQIKYLTTFNDQNIIDLVEEVAFTCEGRRVFIERKNDRIRVYACDKNTNIELDEISFNDYIIITRRLKEDEIPDINKKFGKTIYAKLGKLQKAYKADRNTYFKNERIESTGLEF